MRRGGDWLGSTRLLATPNGSPVQGTTAYYLPYGDYRGSAPTATPLTERGYTGHHENREIGLTYMNARFYSPTSGRFLTADTIVPDAANPQAHNRYTYSLGNPLVFIDPTGHRAETADQGTGGCTGQLGSSLLFECGFNPDYWDGSEIEGYTYQQIALLVLIWIDRQNICNARWIGYYNMLDALARSDYDRYGAAAALYGTAPETFRDTILETLIDPDLLLGIFIGTGAAIRGPGSGGVTDINVVYSPGVQQRMAQDANHNFPVLLDAEIMSANPLLIRPDGRQEFVQRGDINRKQGVFHITLGSDGETIIHRIFLPQNRWDNFAQNYGLPTWSNLP